MGAGFPPIGPDAGPELFAAVSDWLSAATGRRFVVDWWAGAEDVDGWLAPVYSAAQDGGYGDGVADGGQEGWADWLLEQALYG